MIGLPEIEQADDFPVALRIAEQNLAGARRVLEKGRLEAAERREGCAALSDGRQRVRQSFGGGVEQEGGVGAGAGGARAQQGRQDIWAVWIAEAVDEQTGLVQQDLEAAPVKLSRGEPGVCGLPRGIRYIGKDDPAGPGIDRGDKPIGTR